MQSLSMSNEDLGEALYWNDMEIARLELEIQSSMRKHSRMKNSRPESRTQIASEISEHLIEDYDDLYHKKDSMTENERRRRCKLKAPASSSKDELSDSRASGSNQVAKRSMVSYSGSKLCSYSDKRRVVLQASEVEQLNRRLQFLEEEAKILKQTFFGSLEERKELMNEICQLLKTLRSGLGNQVIGEKSHGGVLIIGSQKDGRMETGLSQVLCQESNPSLVIRDFRANTLPFQEPLKLYNLS